MVHRAPEDTPMHVNLRLFDLVWLDARFDDEFLVENFRFRPLVVILKSDGYL